MFGSSQRRRRSHEAVGHDGIAPGRLDVDLEHMIAEYSSLIYHVAYNIVHDVGLAEDVVQETIIKVWRNQRHFRGDSSLKTWLVRIARNTAIDSVRRRREQPTRQGMLPDSTDDSAEGDIERVTQGRMAMSGLARALARLDELSRTIVVLREVNAMSYGEIAEALEIPESTVKTRLMRARRALQESLRTIA